MEEQQQQGRSFPLWARWTIVIIVLLAIGIGLIIWIVSSQGSLPSIMTAIFAALSAVLALFQLFPWLFPPKETKTTSSLVPQPLTQQFFIQGSPVQPVPVQSLSPEAHPAPLQPLTDNTIPSNITSIRRIPPPTSPSSIQQRGQSVKDIYAKLTQPNISGIVLTGIGGLGKSTLAALVYRYAEEQRRQASREFSSEALWFTIDDKTTVTELSGTLLEALGKPVLNFNSLSPQQQAVMLFNALNTADKPRLIVIDQFESLLDWQTGKALDNRPGVGELIDALNSEPCRCRVLLTSRPMPQGTRVTPLTSLQEYPVQGLNTAEGIELLRKQGVSETHATQTELRTVVARYSGHALSLTLLATILRDHNLKLATLSNDPTYERLWTGDIANNLLDYIYTKQLNEVQRKLLLAFSVYREAVPLAASEALIDFNTNITKDQILPTLNALLRQHLLQASGEGRYQLHTIVADYAQRHFGDTDEKTNQQTVLTAHAKAAKYYLQQAALRCPPQEERHSIKGVQPLIEAIWQYCQAEQWQVAYNLIEEEYIFSDLKRWGGNAILLELCRSLLPLDKWNPERSQAAKIYHHLGWVYDDLGQRENALKEYKKALHISKDIGDHRGEGETLGALGRVYDVLGQKEEALTIYRQALRLLKEAGDKSGEGTILNNMGGVYKDLGQTEDADAYYEEALRISKEIGDREGEGVVLNELGLLYEELGLKEEALKYFEKSLTINREVGNRRVEGITLFNIGTLYFERRRYDVAFACFLLARSIFEEILSPDREDVQGWIDNLRETVGEKRFAALQARAKLQTSQIVEQALRVVNSLDVNHEVRANES